MEFYEDLLVKMNIGPFFMAWINLTHTNQAAKSQRKDTYQEITLSRRGPSRVSYVLFITAVLFLCNPVQSCEKLNISLGTFAKVLGYKVIENKSVSIGFYTLCEIK